MPGESYCMRIRSLLLYLCYVFRALTNSLVCGFTMFGEQFNSVEMIKDKISEAHTNQNTCLNGVWSLVSVAFPSRVLLNVAQM